MQHIVLSTEGFTFSSDPFPAFRCRLSFGRTKNDSQFLPVQGVELVTTYKVVEGKLGGKVLYQGTDKAEADKAKAEFDDKKVEASVFGRPFGQKPGEIPAKTYLVAKIEIIGVELPKDNFRLITTKEKGTRMVVSGRDESKDALVFLGEKEGFRGGIRVLEESTTAEIVKNCHAGNNTGGQMEIIARFQVGQTLAIYSWGRYGHDVVQYQWDGEKISKKEYKKSEWDAAQEVAKTTALPDPLPKMYFGFAVSDGMFSGDITIRRQVITLERVKELVAEGVEPTFHPRHLTTVNTMRQRFDIDLAIPEVAPKVNLAVGDRLIVMSLRGLERREDAPEYTQEQIDGASFEFSLWEVVS